MKVNESNRTNNDEVIKELHHRIAELDGMLAEETRQLKEMTAQMEKTSLKKAIDLIMAQPPELHYPAYFADLLREADVPDKDAVECLEIPNSSETIYRQAAIDAEGDKWN